MFFLGVFSSFEESYIFNGILRNEKLPRLCIHCFIGHDPLPSLQRPVLDHSTPNYSICSSTQTILPGHDREVRKADLICVSVHNRRQAEIIRLDLLAVDMQLKVSAIVKLAPLQFPVVRNEIRRSIIGSCESDILAGR